MSVHSVFVAKERLKNLLIADRIQCTPDTADRLTKDLYLTVSKYMEITPEYFDIEITRSDIHIKYAGENK
ncbi:cell division topological specificity factor MinE [Mediterraneibacter glycyrrhizinilyticus]|jgi:cell division topological specificity factor|uniref:cell division topological specificity factor MinE n=1 Tax=Mediterraneibacter glycyrrhizinilyticus TaxID=342942 RepID=UPI000B3AA2DE|nr:cell division topological specificity factor MinE [Mediterraneibacter glycyrrhizinilyticus]OUO30679.1 cell division topological specificity factor MinE [Lachnoclostridium sp. An298]HJA19754.1 cell division topological specificity factor MinE [Candidatus Mediterraneibacter ornithocaccae]MCF2568811.1 cell division topological specificity factor MinE [Mediterraneibacter glycyrrhizinilyticus]MDN0043892.1 cell division topological specificity factor MinE [Mediterraneibacter glycyrrhizinilyticus]